MKLVGPFADLHVFEECNYSLHTEPEFQALFLYSSLSLSLPFIITILAAPKRTTPITPERVQQSRLIGLIQGQWYLATCYQTQLFLAG